MEKVREIFFSGEFEEFYMALSETVRDKFNYALNVVRTQMW